MVQFGEEECGWVMGQGFGCKKGWFFPSSFAERTWLRI